MGLKQSIASYHDSQHRLRKYLSSALLFYDQKEESSELKKNPFYIIPATTETSPKEIYMNDGVVSERKWSLTMGNIRPTYIKSLGTQLIERHPDVFTTDFTQNKENVTKYTDVESKMIRNRVAGYIVRQLRIKEKRKRKEVDIYD